MEESSGPGLKQAIAGEMITGTPDTNCTTSVGTLPLHPQEVGFPPGWART